MDGLSVMFLRMSEGVYQFGSKLVYISTDQYGNLKVKVAGAYMDIEDFIAEYSDIEASKYKKKTNLKDRLKRKFRQAKRGASRPRSNYGVSPGGRSNSSLFR